MDKEQDKYIRIKGAKVNNLKNIDLDIPRDKLVVLTGISGSGKSSLAFETLFAEGQRRFAESLSSFARQFLGRMSKPNVDSITGIPPAIAIEQKVNTRNPRSTIGTSTEISDYLRVLFAKIGKTYSPISGKEVTSDTQDTVLKYIHSFPEGLSLYLLADIKWEESKYRVEKLLNLQEEGFSRLVIYPEDNHKDNSRALNINDAGKVMRIEKFIPELDSFSSSKVMLLVDRLSTSKDEDNTTRLLDSTRIAFEKGEGKIAVEILSDENIALVQCPPLRRSFSNLFEADGMLFERPQEWNFNFNNPMGACTVCGGYGKIIGIDETLVIPNPLISIYEGAIACWKGEMMKFFRDQIIINAEKYQIDIHAPYKDLSKREKDIIWKGNKDIYGIDAFFKELESKRYKIQNKYMINRYSGKTLCHECSGSRLRKEALYVRIGGKNIAELMDMSIKELYSFFKNLVLDEYDSKIASKALLEIQQRLEYIINVGLGYLNLSRASNTLSGGESQRINLVSSLGNSLTGSMYILDEPSIGLHQKDTQKLISVLKSLRDLGNTVIVVEHDEEIMRAADYLIDIGPLAGTHGGEVVFEGELPKSNAYELDENQATENSSKLYKENNIKKSYADLLKKWPQSLSLQYLAGIKKIEIPTFKRVSNNYIEIIGACENNLKNINVKFRLKALTAVCGVSGSGKSTLVGDILYPALRRHIDQIGPKPGLFQELRGDLSKISTIEYVDQNPIGKSSRSNPATYLKIYDDIRKLYSDQPYAKLNGYGHSHFSFNIDGGRCPECQGEGTIKIPMQFMADITMVCESCGGRRFKPDILEVKYKDKNISDILDMTVDEAYEFFNNSSEPQAKRIAKKLIPLMSVGLNYIKLGQSSSTLSGGESQRVKLASFLTKDNKTNTSGDILFIFDEPTTGLHFDDIQKLLESFNALLDRGNTIIVVEHNPYVIQAADYIIELGPEGGSEGGYLI